MSVVSMATSADGALGLARENRLFLTQLLRLRPLPIEKVVHSVRIIHSWDEVVSQPSEVVISRVEEVLNQVEVSLNQVEG